MPASCAAAQMGSQCESRRKGISKSWGWLHIKTARKPRVAQRSISPTEASTSQNGVDMTGTSRLGSSLAHSYRKSLYARTHSSIRLGSFNLRKPAAPNPPTLG